MPTLRVCQNVGLQTTIGINASALTTAGAAIRLAIPMIAERPFDAPHVCGRVLQLCYREVLQWRPPEESGIRQFSREGQRFVMSPASHTVRQSRWTPQPSWRPIRFAHRASSQI